MTVDTSRQVAPESDKSSYEAYKAACLEVLMKRSLDSYGIRSEYLSMRKEDAPMPQEEALARFLTGKQFEAIAADVESTFDDEETRKAVLKEIVAGGGKYETRGNVLKIKLSPVLKHLVSSPELIKKLLKAILEADILMQYQATDSFPAETLFLAALQKKEPISIDPEELSVSIEIDVEQSPEVIAARTENEEKKAKIDPAKTVAIEAVKEFSTQSEAAKTKAVTAHESAQANAGKAIEAYEEVIKKQQDDATAAHGLQRTAATESIAKYKEIVDKERETAQRIYEEKREKALELLRKEESDLAKKLMASIENEEIPFETERKTFYLAHAEDLLGAASLVFPYQRPQKPSAVGQALEEMAKAIQELNTKTQEKEQVKELHKILTGVINGEITEVTIDRRAEYPTYPQEFEKTLRHFGKIFFDENDRPLGKTDSKRAARLQAKTELAKMIGAFKALADSEQKNRSMKVVTEQLKRIVTGQTESVQWQGRLEYIIYAESLEKVMRGLGVTFFQKQVHDLKNASAEDYAIITIKHDLEILFRAHARKEKEERENKSNQVAVDMLTAMLKGEMKTFEQHRESTLNLTRYEDLQKAIEKAGDRILRPGKITEEEAEKDPKAKATLEAKKKLEEIIAVLGEARVAESKIPDAGQKARKREHKQWLAEYFSQNPDKALMMALLVSMRKRQITAEDEKPESTKRATLTEHTELIRQGNEAIYCGEIGMFDADNRFFIEQAGLNYVEAMRRMEAIYKEFENSLREQGFEGELPMLFVKEAEKRIEDLQKEKETLQKTIEETRAQIESILQELEGEKGAKTEITGTVNSLAEELRQLREKERALVAEKEGLEEEIGGLALQVKTLEAQRNQAQDQLAAKIAIGDAFKDEVAALYQRLVTAEGKFFGKTKARAAAMDDLRSLLIKAGILPQEEEK